MCLWKEGNSVGWRGFEKLIFTRMPTVTNINSGQRIARAAVHNYTCKLKISSSSSSSSCSSGVASCPRMSVDILGTSWDQCASMVQYCFASTETIRLVRTESPGRPPRLSHSSWTLNIYIRAKMRSETFPTQKMLGLCYTFSTWHRTQSFLHCAVPRSHREPCFSI